MQVLIIDDSLRDAADPTKDHSTSGFEITEACNGREGLDRLSQLSHVELVLVDWNMHH